MSRARYLTLADKAIDACIAAIEVYNKPDFAYREEAFAILMLNAWELLLKARIARENSGMIRSIEVWETRKRPDGSRTTRKYAKNPSGNNMIIGLDKASSIVQGYAKNKIDSDCAANLALLKEIRANAVHLLNDDPALSKRVQEVGATKGVAPIHRDQKKGSTPNCLNRCSLHRFALIQQVRTCVLLPLFGYHFLQILIRTRIEDLVIDGYRRP